MRSAYALLWMTTALVSSQSARAQTTLTRSTDAGTGRGHSDAESEGAPKGDGNLSFYPHDAFGDATIAGDFGKVEFGLNLQLQGSYRYAEDAPSAPGRHAGSAEVRRLRFLFGGVFLDDIVSFSTQFDLAGPGAELIDAWIDTRLGRGTYLRVGQFKVPFTHYRETSSTHLSLVDWGNVTRYFGSERQLGIMVHNALAGDKLLFDFGAFTGENGRASHAVALAEGYGIEPINRSAFASMSGARALHPELAARFGYRSPGMHLQANEDLARTGLRCAAFLSGTYDVAPQPGEDWAWRVAPEVLLKAHGVGIRGVAYLGFFDPTDPSNDSQWALGAFGALLEASYRFTSPFEIAARYSRVGLRDTLRQDQQSFVGPDGDPAIGRLTGEQEVGLGLNIYLLGHRFEWQNDVAWLHDRFVDGTQNGARFRSQLQLRL